MSVVYRVTEKFCFIFSKRVKKIMGKMFSPTKQSDKLPGEFYRKFCVEQWKREGYPVYIISNKKSATKERALLFLHGGGGMARPTALHYSCVKKLLKYTDYKIFFAFYPLAPQHNALEAVKWLEGVYAKMLNEFESENIAFIGDSAGANLALSVCARVKNKPQKVIAISPAPGLEDGHDRNARKQMESMDPILSVEMNDQIKEYWAKGMPLNSPDINPTYIDFTGMKEMLFVYGTHELFYPHVKALLHRLKKEKIRFARIEEPMCHDFALCEFFPEGKRAMNKIILFLNK